MENRIYGIITIAIVVIIYSCAYKRYLNDKIYSSLSLIILAGLILRIFTSFDYYLHPWDERYHALVAKNLLENPFKPMLYNVPLLEYDYKNWANNHIWVHKQPFPLYSIALSIWLFGKSAFAIRIPSILLNTIAIYATFKIGHQLANRKVGLIAAFLFSINGLIIEQTAGRVATDHVDVFFLSLITLAVYQLFKSVDENSKFSFFIGSLFIGLAILSKWLPALIVVLLWIIYAHNKLKTKQILWQLSLILFIIGMVVFPWQFYIMSQFPLEATWESSYNKLHFFKNLLPVDQAYYYHFDRMRIIFGELVYLPLIWLAYRLTKSKNRQTIFIILSWIIIPYVFFSIAKTKMQAYIIFCAPAIFIMIGIFLQEIQQYKQKLKIMVTLISMLLIALPIRYSIERIKPFQLRDRNPEWISQIKSIDSAKPNTKKVIFNCQYPIESMFYTNMICYNRIPSLDKLHEILSKGYDIYIDDFYPIDNKFSNINFVQYVSLSK